MGAKLLPLTKDETSSVGKIWEDAERLGKPFTWMQRSKITGGFIGSAIAFMDKSVKKNHSMLLFGLMTYTASIGPI